MTVSGFLIVLVSEAKPVITISYFHIIYLKGRKEEKDKETEVFHSVVHSPKASH